MPNIQGGGGFIPQPIQPQRQVQPAAQVQAEVAQTVLAPKDSLKMAGPSQTSQTSQAAQRLTSDETKSQIHQLIQRADIQVPTEKPNLQMMQKPAMGSALAEMLQGHHVPDAQATPQQQAQQQAQQAMQQPGAQAQAFAGQQQTSTFVRLRDTNEDAADRNSLQSGKRVRKDEKEGEFDSLEDFGGSGASGQQGSGQDQRSDSQKKKQLLTAEDRRKPPPGAKPTVVAAPRPPAPKAASIVPKPPQPPKPAAPKPAVQRVQPPLGQQKPPAPPKKPTDEWTI